MGTNKKIANMSEKEIIPQVKNNIELLQLMLNDIKNVANIYKPTNYWQNYEKIFLPELQVEGLKDFRRRKNSVLSSFGATDLLPLSRHINHLNIWGRKPLALRIVNRLLQVKMLGKLYNYISRAISGVGLQEIRLLHYEIAKGYGERSGTKSISKLEASTVGNPEDVFSINGKLYTTSILNYYIQYAYCNQFIGDNKIRTIMEIGSGSGKQIEVIKKLNPEICIYIFDIPPQLYVCEQYLSAIFPESIVSYTETREMRSIPENSSGKIFIFGNWKLPEITGLNYDLFINSASFQEMEPDVVLNYLTYVDRQTNKYIFLHELMEGKKEAHSKGNFGVLSPTTIDHYKQGLKSFRIVDLSQSIDLTQIASPYKFSFWKKKNVENSIVVVG